MLSSNAQWLPHHLLISGAIDLEAMNIGVVIVNYNSGHYLRRCIDSLLRSDVSIAVIIVDNNSSDHSISEISPQLNVNECLSLVTNQDNVGFSAGVNIGIEHLLAVNGEVESILVLNPDCEVHPHTVGKLAQALEQTVDIGIVGPIVFNQNGVEQRGCRRREPTLKRSMVTALGLSNVLEGIDMTNQPMPSAMTEVDAVSGAAMMISRKYLDQIGGMDESYFLHCEDLDLCRRMREAGFRVVLDPGVSVFHKQGVSGGANFDLVERLKHDGMVKYYSHHYAGKSRFNKQLIKVLVWTHFIVASVRHRISPKHANEIPDSQLLFSIDPEKDYVLLTGANSDVGESLLQSILDEQRHEVIAVFRDGGSTLAQNVRCLTTSYFDKAPVDDQPRFNRWVNLAPIWSSESFRSVIRNSKLDRMIAVSSTSVTAKADSRNPKELKVVRQLVQGELDSRKIAKDSGANCVILRPTLIYGGPRNRSINLVRKVIQRIKIFPLFGEGAGLRQPVHVADVAAACAALLDRSPENELYTIAGSEVLSYRKMISRVFTNLGYKARFIRIPYRVAVLPLWVLSRIPGLQLLTPQIAHRMEKDQVFSNEKAARDFDFHPRNFQP